MVWIAKKIWDMNQTYMERIVLSMILLLIPRTMSAIGSNKMATIRKVEQFLEAKLGKQPGWDNDALEEAMKRFENGIERQFRGTFGEHFSIPVPGLANDTTLSIKRTKMTLTRTEVRLIFEPVLNKVTQLVIRQLKASKKVWWGALVRVLILEMLSVRRSRAHSVRRRS